MSRRHKRNNNTNNDVMENVAKAEEQHVETPTPAPEEKPADIPDDQEQTKAKFLDKAKVAGFKAAEGIKAFGGKVWDNRGKIGIAIGVAAATLVAVVSNREELPGDDEEDDDYEVDEDPAAEDEFEDEPESEPETEEVAAE